MLERVTRSFIDLGYQFLDVIPKLAGAIIILIIGWIISKFIGGLVRKLMKALRIDRLGDKLNEIDLVYKSSFNVVISDIIGKIVYYFLFLLFAMVAADLLEFEAITTLIYSIFDFIPRLIAACIVLGFGLVIADLLKKVVNTTTRSLGIPSAKLIGSFIFYFILLMTIVTALSQLGIDTDFISTNLSVILAGAVFAFGIGYGIASKDTMANFLASFYSKDRFKIGDKIKIEDAQGEIIEMDNSTITLQGNSNQKIIIPLKKLTTEKVEIL